jgi:TPR repeat protein
MTKMVSLEEKMACMPVIDEILKMAEMARSGGLLALDGLIAEAKDSLMQTGLRLITDGVRPAMVRATLAAQVAASAQKGAALLRQVIVCEGIMSLQNGDRSEYIKDKLYIIMGEDFVRETERGGTGSAAAGLYYGLAEDGAPAAMHDLGLLFQNGDGISADDEKAFQWFERAAKDGHAEAMYRLGLCYEFGNGVEENLPKALYWHSEALENGCTYDRYAVERIEEKMEEKTA